MSIYDEFKTAAHEKLCNELKDFKSDDRKAKCVKNSVCDALKLFCLQNGEFAQAVAQSSKTLSEVCSTAMKGTGSSVSDLQVYQKTVEQYFPGAKVNFNMSIDLMGDISKQSSSSKVIDLDLTDLLGM